MLIPLGQALLAQTAGPDQLGRLMGAIGLPAMVGVVFGPVIGGVIVTHLGWQWIFWINLPIALLAIAASLRFMPPTTALSGQHPLDRLGLALLPPGLALFVYGLSRAGSERSLTTPSVSVPMTLGAVLVVAFIWHALRSRHPLIDLRLFRRRSFAAATTVMFLFGFAMFGLVLLVPLYLQQARGWSAVHAGMLALPQGLGMAIGLSVSRE
jgi:MFS family permease